MTINTTLASCNQNPALNGPDGASDLPSSMDDALRYALSFIAQIRDGVGTSYTTGMVANFATATTPAQWLKLNGQLVSRTTYANLFAFASAAGLVSEAAWTGGAWGQFSVGDGSTTFRLPDMRGLVVKGLDEARGLDPSRTFGSFQDHALLSHSHTISDPSHTHTGGDTGHNHSASTDVQGVHAHSQSYPAFTGITAQSGPFGNLTSGGNAGGSTSADGGHGHNISVNTGFAAISINGAFTGINGTNASGGTQNIVRNVAWPFYIKY